MNETMIEEYGLDKISVVIPMYNSDHTIISTLESIRNQTAFEKILEIIIVNDGSKDNSLETVLNYKNANKKMPILIINKKNAGVSSARNIGIKTARGKWIALLDSDDEWLPEKIDTQINIIKENPDIDFLGGDINDKGFRILNRRINDLYKATVRDMCIKSFPQPSTIIFKKNIFDEIGGFDESQSYCEDINYFIRICNRYNLYHYPKQMILFDGGKPDYGFQGLSANMKMMHKGSLKNIEDFKNDSIISFKFYTFLWMFYWLKYFRRLIIVWMRKK